ncbi:POT family proton-dependent oligopeptide transporter [Aquimarina sp. EL_43]|uniref:peptide MFS transporter n=1 Tax=unclassified Aquimarina TaxID=2627091 RepID=UPI0018CB47DF|nr:MULTISPECIES: peptide MFS transporter [unclassified Aquimarina]MBG6130952.1 POT family proton-dependent oligopeptide transporter [Aquimarina sp. EL_35]MBG6151411.1 POT family proton-dependent oligopeptide transporter [Aquimarina sp. EL_32]MBG6169342.1 POT family proton-dependent oligopeptide transporter [Aquimarina sp. EL_43]
MNSDQTEVNRQEVFGHPKGLLYLFFAELWERFSFYGMKALLVLYMTKHLLYSDDKSFGVMAAYMSLVYVTPMIGGIIADRYIGYRKSIILGGVLMAAGHFFLTIETPVFFYGSLALIIVGNGFFKPNISTMVGTLYKEGDRRRDSGFTIFYLGINLGGAIAPLMCAWLAELYGWHYGFLLAGIGMLVGLLVFKRGTQLAVFGDKGLVPDIKNYEKKIYGLNKGDRVWFLAWLSVPVFALIVRFNEFEHYLVWIATFFLIGYITYILTKVSIKERKRLLVAVYFTSLYALFAAVFEQAGSSLTLFADRNVNLIGINAAQTNSINSTWIVVLAIPFALLWTFLSKKKANPNSAIKFGLGMLFLGLGFLIFGMSAQEVDEYARTPMFYLIFGYLVLTVGELFLSPIGLSKITELSPIKYVTFIMGVWFSANFYGHFFAGKIAKLTTVKEGEASIFSEGLSGTISEAITGLSSTLVDGNNTEAFQQLYSYVSVYANFGVITMGIGIVAILISPIIKKLMTGIH